MKGLGEQIGLALVRGFARGLVGQHQAPARVVGRKRVARKAPAQVPASRPMGVGELITQGLEQDLAEQIDAAFLASVGPGPAAPAEETSAIDNLIADLAHPPAPSVSLPLATGRWSKSCRARCAHTGRNCALLEGHPGGDPEVHAHGRVTFTAMAAPGQTYFAGREELELRAHARSEAVIDEVGQTARRRQQNRQAKQRRLARQQAQGGTSNG